MCFVSMITGNYLLTKLRAQCPQSLLLFTLENKVLDTHFSYKNVQGRCLNVKLFFSKGLNIKANCRGYVRNTFLVCIALSYDNTFQAKRVGDIDISVFFDGNLERLHFSFLLFVGIHLLTGQRVAMKKNVHL